MPEDGHVRRLLPLVAAVAARGVRARVWTDLRFAEDVARAGGECADLFAGRPLEAADAESMPVPCRFVTFAGLHGEEVLREVERERPSLVVYDSFAVVGRAVAARLGVPSVHACAGHAVLPGPFLAALARDPRVRVTDRCRAAADVLRERFGLEDASPFAYVAPPSRALNVLGEPPEWWTVVERADFEPAAFFGCLPAAPPPPRPPRAGDAPLRLYASFGTVVWRYHAREAVAALGAVARAVARRPGIEATIALGGARLAAAEAAALEAPRVVARPRVDQDRALAGADLFVTHHGLNSTHEAVRAGVPMLSYPFFWDQPALAARAQALGLALPLSSAPRGPLEDASVDAAIEEALARRDGMRAPLEEARAWEERVIERRGEVVDRLLALVS
jgi:UDP:flavonoid glycosyltransferase YjiC (YdhE family)